MNSPLMLELTGELIFDTVVTKRSFFIKAISQASENEIQVDMAAVTRSDSAGLALMIEGLRVAHRHNKTLKYQEVPLSLNRLANFCGLQALFDSK